MPSILSEKSIAANTTDPNIIAGSSYEFARGAGVVSIGMTQTATGLVANIQAGAEIVAESFSIPILAVHPIIPDHMYFAAGLNQGDRLVERVQNTTAGAITVRAVSQFSFQG